MAKEDAGDRRAKVILVALCMVAAGTIAGAAMVRYVFWGDQLPDGFSASAVDYDGDGMPEYLVTRAVVSVPESGDYGVTATLAEPGTGTVIAQTTGDVELDRGENIFGSGFWAPEIRKSEISGPYLVRLTFVREQSDEFLEPTVGPDMLGRVYESTFTTPAYDWRSFQEQPVVIKVNGPVTSAVTDLDSDGRADLYEINVPLRVNRVGTYGIRAYSDSLALQPAANGLAPAGNDPQFMALSPGEQLVTLSVPAQTVYLSGVDGPVQYRITVSDSQLESDPYGPSRLVESPEFAPPPDGYDLGLRDPYVLPPTPLGLKAETTFSETIHWYDFEAPWMPIEFTGAVTDHGTDLDQDGLFDYLTVDAEVHVLQAGSYDLSGTLYVQGAAPSSLALTRTVPTMDYVVTTAWTRHTLGEGYMSVGLDFAGAEILAAGHDGPYMAKLRIVPAHVRIDPVVAHTTALYTLSQFEATGAKPYRIAGVTVTPEPQTGQYEIAIDTSGVDSSYQVTLRVIHANGLVPLDTTFQAGSVATFGFAPEDGAPKDYAVAVYLADPWGAGVDYLETPLAES